MLHISKCRKLRLYDLKTAVAYLCFDKYHASEKEDMKESRAYRKQEMYKSITSESVKKILVVNFAKSKSFMKILI